MKLTRSEEVAILVVSELASQSGIPVPLSKIAEKHGLSALFLKKTVRLLKSGGLVGSREGASGGYTLTNRDISVLEVLSAVSGTGALSSSAPCPLFPSCLPQNIRRKVTDAIAASLSSITINSL